MSKKNPTLEALVPLYIVSLSEGCLKGRTRLQKIIFLVQDKLAKIVDYEFQKAYYGPYSYKLCSIVDELASLGVLEEVVETTASGHDMICYQMTKSGQALLRHWLNQNMLSQRAKKGIDNIFDEYGRIPLPLLVRRVYREYPEWTEKSALLSP